MFASPIADVQSPWHVPPLRLYERSVTLRWAMRVRFFSLAKACFALFSPEGRSAAYTNPCSSKVAMSVPDERIVALIAKGSGADGTQKVGCARDIMQILQPPQMRIPPASVALHWSNRGGFGLSVQHCHSLLRGFRKNGFFFRGHAVVIPDGPLKRCQSFTQNIYDGSPYLPNTCEGVFGSIGAGHTNQELIQLISLLFRFLLFAPRLGIGTRTRDVSKTPNPYGADGAQRCLRRK